MELAVFIATTVVVAASCIAYSIGYRRGENSMKERVKGILKKMRE